MAAVTQDRNVLAEAFGANQGAARLIKEVALVAAGVAILMLASKLRVPFWPVPLTMQTFAVLTIGTAYGLRLSILTLLAWMALGAAGVAVFSGEAAGLAYFAGPTGGYLVGFVLAGALMGALAERGMSKSIAGMVSALALGNVVIYAFGLPWMAWLFAAEHGMGWVVKFGMTNFLLGDLAKLALAALLLPAIWRLKTR